MENQACHFIYHENENGDQYEIKQSRHHVIEPRCALSATGARVRLCHAGLMSADNQRHNVDRRLEANVAVHHRALLALLDETNNKGALMLHA